MTRDLAWDFDHVAEYLGQVALGDMAFASAGGSEPRERTCFCFSPSGWIGRGADAAA